MNTLKTRRPDIIQAFDKYIDREYYKISKGFIFSSETLLRADRISESKQWKISCETLPDKIYINGEEYKLNKL